VRPPARGRPHRRSLLALGLLVLAAALLAPHVSESPDGLEKVAQRLGFADAGATAPTWDGAPAPDYVAPGTGGGALSTVVAGVIGAAVTGLTALGLGWLLARRRRNRSPAQSGGRGGSP
jgi:hypothetical protein